MSRQQCLGKINKVYTDKCLSIDHQQKTTSVMNVGELTNLSLLKSTACTWAMVLKRNELLIAVQLTGDYGSGQRDYFFTSWL
jgi:hypothetical protein